MIAVKVTAESRADGSAERRHHVSPVTGRPGPGIPGRPYRPSLEESDTVSCHDGCTQVAPLTLIPGNRVASMNERLFRMRATAVRAALLEHRALASEGASVPFRPFCAANGRHALD